MLLNVKTKDVGLIDHTIITGDPFNYTDPVTSAITTTSTNPELGDSTVFPIFYRLNLDFLNAKIRFTRLDGSYTTAKIVYYSGWNNTTTHINTTSPAYVGNNDDYVLLKLDRNITNSKIKLPYFNCYTFGNGVESDRIRDDFNAVKLDKGVKASTVLDEPYKEEQRTNGLIYSGIYNSNSGVNNLNQFIAAEKITKDVNPTYGSIQKLKARDTDLVTFCEDKILKIVAYKDALYKADGNPDIISTNKVLGQTTSFAGEFGISQNPESFAQESFRLYCTDKQRGKVLRISGDGVTPISSVGMKDYFFDNLKLNNNLIGSFDDKKGEYNLTLKEQGVTVAFSEESKGWTSFKSFIQENGLSLNNDYYTFKNGKMYKHHANQTRNNFYGDPYDSHVDVLFNLQSESVKHFGSMKYEGSQAKITQNLTDGEYYNNIEKDGWYIESGYTDLQKAGQMEFKNKEGKWFSHMKGSLAKNVEDLNSSEFSFQGIDVVSTVGGGSSVFGCTDPVAINYNPSANTDDGSCEYPPPSPAGPTTTITTGTSTGTGGVISTGTGGGTSTGTGGGSTPPPPPVQTFNITVRDLGDLD